MVPTLEGMRQHVGSRASAEHARWNGRNGGDKQHPNERWKVDGDVGEVPIMFHVPWSPYISAWQWCVRTANFALDEVEPSVQRCTCEPPISAVLPESSSRSVRRPGRWRTHPPIPATPPYIGRR